MYINATPTSILRYDRVIEYREWNVLCRDANLYTRCRKIISMLIANLTSRHKIVGTAPALSFFLKKNWNETNF